MKKRSNLAEVLLLAARMGSVDGHTLKTAARLLREASRGQEEDQVRDDGGNPPTQYH